MCLLFMDTVPIEKSSLVIRDWSCHRCFFQGAFYFEGDSIISHQYTLKVERESVHEVSIRPLETAPVPVDCQLFLFRLLSREEAEEQREASSAGSRSSVRSASSAGSATAEGRLHFVARTPVVPPSAARKGWTKEWRKRKCGL